MIRRFLAQAACLLVFATLLSACNQRTYDPNKVPVQAWFKKKGARQPKMAKTEYTELSGRVNQSVLNRSNGTNTHVVIDIASQTGYLVVGGDIAAQSPVSTARPGKHTPRGTFSISERVRSGKISTIYKVAMPYWMRLDNSPIGMHAGYVPGYPASAGCVRFPSEMARLIYDHTRTGTTVRIR